MIKIENVSKSYVKERKAVDNLSIEINNREIFGFLGPNGAGKTTTIKMITGILNPDEGDIFIDGSSIKKQPIQAKDKFGYVPDNSDIIWRLKGIEYLNFLADIYKVDKKTRKERIERLCETFELKDAIHNYINTYSRGMKQKLLLIGSLIHDPQNWILDEPIVGLDPLMAHTLKTMMKEKADEGKSIFFSTHILEIAEQLCDRVGIINKGKLIFVGTISELQTIKNQKGTLEELFLELVDE
ncbi:MAG: ABC transporter ATP-binding protein [Spirochaetales bacterium]|jgi:ABC-2 type transport system ATP-binding protein|nr:ABC transporter ATP-binding protein [Exilispira sp.]NMC67724.1 ABC transporter ATP-binding protein [Spirochaetales bacterium]